MQLATTHVAQPTDSHSSVTDTLSTFKPALLQTLEQSAALLILNTSALLGW